MDVWLQAALWGAVAALPLIVGVLVAERVDMQPRTIGLVAAFGAGALISAVAFDLVLEASTAGVPWLSAALLAAGAIAYWGGNRAVARRAGGGGGSTARGTALLLGAVIDGVPESFILGLTVALQGTVSISFLVAVAVSNFPEAVTSASALKSDPLFPPRRLLGMWGIVVAVSAIFAGLGGLLGSDVSAAMSAAAKAFAAGGLLTMITDDMIPEADEKVGPAAGLAVVLGFAVAFALHQLGA